jgi:Gas vesicle synthesis protein GvpL/GvpF
MAATPSKNALYLYGVVPARASTAGAGTGIDGAPVQLVVHGDVAALTGAVTDDFLEAGRQELLTHSRVLEEAMGRSAVLPMRFGVVMPDEQTIKDRLLDPYAEELEAQLAAVEGKVEVSIRGIYDEAAILREALAENREIAALRDSIKGKPEEATYPQRIRLGEMVAQALDDKRATVAPEIIERLALHAVDVRVGEPVHERMAVNGSFLVERERLAEFDRAVEQIGAEQAGRIRIKYTGPLPPHSFVQLGVGA